MKKFNEWLENYSPLLSDPYKHDNAKSFLTKNISKSFPISIDPRSNKLFVFSQGTPDWFVEFIKYNYKMSVQVLPAEQILNMEKQEYQLLLY